MKKEGTKNSKKKLIVIIVILALLVLVTAGTLAAYLYFFSPKMQVAMAIVNTFDGYPKLAEDIREHPIRTENYSVTTNFDMELDNVGEVGLKLDIQADDNGKSASGSIDIPIVKGVKIDAELTDEKLLIDVPLLKNTLLSYDYTKENHGMIADYVDTKALNEALAIIYKINLGKNGVFGFSVEPEDLENIDADDVEDTGLKAELVAVLYEFYKDVEFHKVDSKEFLVNGDDQKCKGYSTIVYENEMTDVIAKLEDVCLDYDVDTTDMFGMSTEELFDAMEEKAEELGEVELFFYIYDDALAAMEITTDKSDISLRFEGGAFRWQNTKLIVNDKTLFEIEGELTDEAETMTVFADVDYGDKEIKRGVSYTYELATGNLEASYLGEDKEIIESLSGNLSFEEEEGYIHIKVDPYTVNGFTFSGSLTVKEEGEVEHLSGDELDIGVMTEDEYNAFVEDFMKNKLGGLGGALLDFLW